MPILVSFYYCCCGWSIMSYKFIFLFKDLDKMNEKRRNMPYLTQKRKDLYEVKQL